MAAPTKARRLPSLRDRKRQRTRQAVIEAATDLFRTRGYERTTVADIAAAADIGTRTFFSYFASKEEVLWPESDERVEAAVRAIMNRGLEDRPVDVLFRALREVGETGTDMVSPLAALRLRLIRTVPVVRGRALQIQADAQGEIARHLHEAFPDELDQVSAAALVGAFVGAVTGALQVLLTDLDEAVGDPLDAEQLRAQLLRATSIALRPWIPEP
jgi:AcrR family transcriptional regulator